jgi:hypothetical protein
MIFRSRHERSIRGLLGKIRVPTAGRLMVLVLTMAAFALASPGSAVASGWSIQATPPLNGPPQGGLYSVSCSATACVALGNYVNPAGVQVPLVEQSNGGAWARQATPELPGGGVLNGVSCAATSCIAVGYEINGSGEQVILAEQWNSTTGWTITPTPLPSLSISSVLSGVSCPSANYCIAVGDYNLSSGATVTLAEQWNGQAWAVSTSMPALGGGLARVSCSAANACTAIGNSGGLIERWDGTTWTAQTMAIPTGWTHASAALYGVSCAGATLCIGVGHFYEYRCNNGQPTCNCLRTGCTMRSGELTEEWNGSAWTIQSTYLLGTIEGVLHDISCSSAAACTAVGTDGGSAVAEQWNGTSWSMPAPTSGGTLVSVSYRAATACEAVGQSGGTLAEDWNGSSWAIQPTPNPPGPAASILSGVSCTSSAACTAVGVYVNATGRSVALGEDWNGTSWSQQSTPSPAGPMNSSLSAVSCTTTGTCAATGAYDDTTIGGNPPPDIALGEVWNGSGWTIDPTASLGAGYDSVLSGVDCLSAAECIAVGYDYYNQGPQDAVLAEQWDGTSWTIEPGLAPSSGTLSSVSCATRTSCMAVGEVDVSSPLAEQWDGSSWTIRPTPGGSLGGPLLSVSCPTATACIAVGGQGTPVADSWNGTGWTAQAVPLPAGSNGGQLSSVSCTSATDCIAVGYWLTNTGPAQTLAEHWDGTTWTIEPTPNPNNPVDSYLSGVSCTTPTSCTAVGHYENQANMDVKLVEQYSG